MIAATQEVLLRDGVDAFTVDAVARTSGVAKSTIYRHYASGDELLLDAVAAMLHDVEPPDTGSFRGDLTVVIGQVLDVARTPALRRLLLSMLSRSIVDPEFADVYRRMKAQRHTPLRAVLQRAMARGEVAPDIDIELALQFVQGPFVVKRLIDNEDLSEREVAVFADLVERALAPRTAG